MISSKKNDYNTKISANESKIVTDHDKYITTQEFNKLTENFAPRLKKVNLANNSDIANFVKKNRFW